MKLRGALLCGLAMVSPAIAHAAPVSLFFAGLAGGSVSGLIAAVAGGAFTTAAYTAGTFFSTVVGGLLLNLGLNVAANALLRPKSPGVQEAQSNVRFDIATRWQLAGNVAVGGSIGTFVEKDSVGNLWYIVAHGDAELTGAATYILDGVPVVLSDGTDGFTLGDVITDDFCLNLHGGQFTPAYVTRYPTFRLYTVTPSSIAVYGSLPAAFTAAFPNLPLDFYLAGVCYTIVRCRALDRARYDVAMRWRGVLGLGEPSVMMVGNFNRMYDPRIAAHNKNDSTTWTASTGNTEIIWAWWRTTRYGRNRPMSEIDWDTVALKADICDKTVLNRAGATTPLYRGGVAFPDSKPRQECEKEILDGMDAFVAYNDAGKAYAEPGFYAAPTLTFTGRRDIFAIQTISTDEGEQPSDGVVVNYIEPGLGYVKQPCAPWYNTDWYDGVSAPNLLYFDILSCQNHNQAVRLAKAIGKRLAPKHKAGMTVTVKGLLAKGQRAIDLQYDATFTGPFEIVSPVAEDPNGTGFAFAVVPLGTDRWFLNAGEEGAPPQATPLLAIPDSNAVYPLPGNLTSVAAAGGVGTYTISFTTANDVNQALVAIKRGSTNVYSASTLIDTVIVPANASTFYTETGVATGTKYVWAVPLNTARNEGTPAGPNTVTIT